MHFHHPLLQSIVSLLFSPSTLLFPALSSEGDVTDFVEPPSANTWATDPVFFSEALEVEAELYVD
jgi:hypothetical protein